MTLAPRHAIVLLAILVLGAGLRLHDFGADSLWLDEFFALENSTGRGFEHWRLPQGQVLEHPPALTSLAGARPLWAIWTSLRGDTHPPLHFMVLRLWREALGEGDAAARGLSLVFGMASLPLLFLLARRIAGDIPALWATLLMAATPVHVRYAQEARNYTMALCLVLTTALLLVPRAGRVGSGASRWSTIGLALLVLASVLTHYFTVTAVAMLALFAMLRPDERSRPALFAAVVGAALVFLVLWGPRMWEQRVNFAQHFDVEASEGHLLLTLQRWLAVPVWFLVGTPVPARAKGLEMALGLCCYLVPFLFLRRRPDLLLPALWLTGATLVLALLDATRNNSTLAVPRYPIFASPGLFLLLGAAARGRAWRHVIPLAALVLALAHRDRAYGGRADWREVAAFVRHGMRGGEVLVVDFEGQPRWFPATNYLALSHYLGRDCPPVVLLEGPVEQLARNRLREAGAAWVLTKGEEGTFADRLGGRFTGQAVPFDNIGVMAEVEFARLR